MADGGCGHNEVMIVPRFDTQCTLTVVSDGTGGRGMPISSCIDKVEDEDDGGGSDR